MSVYTATAANNIEGGKYVAFTQDDDAHIIIDFISPDPAETAKMASTLKF